MLKELKTTEIKTVREAVLKEQDGLCPLCGKPVVNPCLDHQHKLRKADEPGIDGAGLVRGVLCRDCNALEGRIWNAMNRCLQPATVQERIDFLKNLVSYYNKTPYSMVYPGCTPKRKVSKRNFNRLNKLYQTDNPSKKPLEYPKKGYMTKNLSVLFDQYNISPYN